jgi:S-adenosylmethionine:tRNA ribosyltransferase-isomerase
LRHEVGADRTRHVVFSELPDLLRRGDLLVLNDTKVLPARLYGQRSSGGVVEFLFVEPLDSGRWQAMVNPARKLRAGEVVTAASGAVLVRPVERVIEPDGKPSAYWVVELFAGGGEIIDPVRLLEEHGHIPLPPYIHREGRDAPDDPVDSERYQTVYASEAGAVAAPTAGLHFTEELLDELERGGIERAMVTLHVGPGTFRPVEVEELTEHRMHFERFDLPEATIDKIEACRERGGRVVAVGTTCVRVLEACARPDGSMRPGPGRTDLFIAPGYEFRAVDLLLTNFHLPRSTLLMLVAAFVGRERILRLYQEAIEARYRFYSYGDAMLLGE